MEKYLNILKTQIEEIGATVLEAITGLGTMCMFAGRFFYWSVRPPFRWKLLFEQLFFRKVWITIQRS